MKRFFKGFIVLLVISISISVVSVFHSCQTDGEKRDGTVLSKASDLIKCYQENYAKITTTPIVSIPTTRSSIISHGEKGDDVTLYINFPADTQEEVKDLYHHIQTIQDICALHRLTAAEFECSNSSNSKYSIQVSETKVRQELSPMVNASRQYLYSKGISESDIQELLEENNADETVLSVFALLLSEQEMRERISSNKISTASFNPLGFFATPAYCARDKGRLSYAFDCAIEALGVDIFFCLSSSRAVAWSKAAMNKTFKTVAKRVMGPIGVAIALGEFLWCLHKQHVCNNNNDNKTAYVGTPDMIDSLYNDIAIRKPKFKR